jgi:hypothetical protein
MSGYVRVLSWQCGAANKRRHRVNKQWIGHVNRWPHRQPCLGCPCGGWRRLACTGSCKVRKRVTPCVVWLSDLSVQSCVCVDGERMVNVNFIVPGRMGKNAQHGSTQHQGCHATEQQQLPAGKQRAVRYEGGRGRRAREVAVAHGAKSDGSE